MMLVPKSANANSMQGPAGPRPSEANLLMAAAEMHRMGRLTKKPKSKIAEDLPEINFDAPEGQPATPAGETPTPAGIRG